jgi:hypothetical protein
MCHRTSGLTNVATVYLCQINVLEGELCMDHHSETDSHRDGDMDSYQVTF